MKTEQVKYSYGEYLLKQFGISEDYLFECPIEELKALICLLKETLEQKIELAR